MLVNFKVKGFKGFEEEFEINFLKSKNYDFNEQCILNGNIKNIIVYGKNSVGKSNFGLAVMDIVSHLEDKNVGPKLYDNYLNINSDIAEFHYKFQFNNDIIDYYYIKKDLRELVFEELKLNDEIILCHDYINNISDYQGANKISPTLNYEFYTNGSKLRYFLTNSSLENTSPLHKFIKFIANMLWFRTLDENRYIGYKTKSDDYLKFILDDKSLRNEFETLLNEAGIDGKLAVRTNPNDGVKTLYFNKNDKFLPFFATASSGTKALYTFFYWYNTAKDASFICIDEFDAYYHFELAEKIVKILKQMPQTQSMVTTHNTNLLSNKLMRPDCYFILTNNRLTSLPNATKMELREGHNLEKLYIAGEFCE